MPPDPGPRLRDGIRPSSVRGRGRIFRHGEEEGGWGGAGGGEGGWATSHAWNILIASRSPPTPPNSLEPCAPSPGRLRTKTTMENATFNQTMMRIKDPKLSIPVSLPATPTFPSPLTHHVPCKSKLFWRRETRRHYLRARWL